LQVASSLSLRGLVESPDGVRPGRNFGRSNHRLTTSGQFASTAIAWDDGRSPVHTCRPHWRLKAQNCEFPHTSKIDRPPSACLKIRILSSVLYFLPFIRLVPFGPDYLIPRLEKAQSRHCLLSLRVTGLRIRKRIPATGAPAADWRLRRSFIWSSRSMQYKRESLTARDVNVHTLQQLVASFSMRLDLVS
jgi:hypothetical protein